MADATQGEKLAALEVQIDGMTDSLLQHIQAAESRIASRLDAMGWRIGILEANHGEHKAFRDTFVDDEGNHINGKSVIKRIVALEKTIGAFKSVALMGRGAVMAAGFMLLILVKGAWEGIEWILGKLGG